MSNQLGIFVFSRFFSLRFPIPKVSVSNWLKRPFLFQGLLHLAAGGSSCRAVRVAGNTLVVIQQLNEAL